MAPFLYSISGGGDLPVAYHTAVSDHRAARFYGKICIKNIDSMQFFPYCIFSKEVQ